MRSPSAWKRLSPSWLNRASSKNPPSRTQSSSSNHEEIAPRQQQRKLNSRCGGGMVCICRKKGPRPHRRVCESFSGHAISARAKPGLTIAVGRAEDIALHTAADIAALACRARITRRRQNRAAVGMASRRNHLATKMAARKHVAKTRCADLSSPHAMWRPQNLSPEPVLGTT